MYVSGSDVLGDSPVGTLAAPTVITSLNPIQEFAVQRYGASTPNGITDAQAIDALNAYYQTHRGVYVDPNGITEAEQEVLAALAHSLQTTQSVTAMYQSEGVLTPELASFVQATAFDPATGQPLAVGATDPSTGHVITDTDVAIRTPAVDTSSSSASRPAIATDTAGEAIVAPPAGPVDVLPAPMSTELTASSGVSKRTLLIGAAAVVGVGALLALASSHNRRS